MQDQDEGGVSPSDRSTEEFTWTEEEETAVRRKLDRVIVPLTTFLYLLCFLDRYVFSLPSVTPALSNTQQCQRRKRAHPGHGRRAELEHRLPLQLGHLHLLHRLHVRRRQVSSIT